MTAHALLSTIVLTLPLLAADPVRLTPEKIRRIEQSISTEMARSTIPGINAAIGTGAEVQWTGAYGMADLENLVPMTSHTVIRLASISKPITATAVLQLVEAGRIQLDSPIQDYVPQFPPKPWPVTVRQLLGHLGGVRHYRDDEIASTRHYANREDPLAIFASDPLEHEPGTQYLYSTYGFNLLGAAVELVSGMPFIEYLNANVFRKAQMEETRDDSVYALIPHRSRGYALGANSRIVNCGLADTSNKIPGGGLVAPAADLVRFALALDRGRLLQSGTVEMMLTSQATRDGKPTGYGMGFSTGIRNGRRFASHSGGQQGTSTFLILFPADHAAITVMANREDAAMEPLAQQIAAILFE